MAALTLSPGAEDLRAELVQVVDSGGSVFFRGVVAPSVGRVLSLHQLSTEQTR